MRVTNLRMQRMDFTAAIVGAVLTAAGVLLPTANVTATMIMEDWNDGLVDGWAGSTVTVPANGGMDNSPFLNVSRVNGSPYVIAGSSASQGAFDGNLTSKYGTAFPLTFHLKETASNISGMSLIVASGTTNWTWALGNPTSSWEQYARTIVASDSTGWTKGGVGALTWAQTLQNVTSITFDVTSSGGTTRTFCLDNFAMGTVDVPEPSTLTLFGVGLMGLMAYAWRGRK